MGKNFVDESFSIESYRKSITRNTSNSIDPEKFKKLCNTHQCIVGIDPGLKGGIAYYIPELDFLFYRAVATKIQYGESDIDVVTLQELILDLIGIYDVKVYIEDVHSIFGVSAKSNFSFGFGFGKIVSVIEGLKIPLEFVQPKKWQSVVWKTSDIVKEPDIVKADGKIKKGKVHTKESTINAVKRMYPSYSFLATEKSKKIHDGITDSVAIMTYGLIVEGIYKIF